MKNEPSPRQIMKIIDATEKAIWKNYKSYSRVFLYIKRWQEEIWDAGNTGWNGYNGFNFEIAYRNIDNREIDLFQTLYNMNHDLLFKIAFDMEIQIPGIIYAVPEVIKICLENNFQTARLSFEDACKKAYENPDSACVKANCALETIIKEILKNKKAEYKEKDSLYNLARTILKEFKFSEIEASRS